MKQPIMKKTLLVSAISMSIGSTYAVAAVPDQLPITNMAFTTTGVVYSAGGFFNVNGVIGPLDLSTDFVDDPRVIGLLRKKIP